MFSLKRDNVYFFIFAARFSFRESSHGRYECDSYNYNYANRDLYPMGACDGIFPLIEYILLL